MVIMAATLRMIDTRSSLMNKQLDKAACMLEQQQRYIEQLKTQLSVQEAIAQDHATP